MLLNDISFRGLIRNMSFASTTGPRLIAALRDAGWREGTGTHFVQRLRSRGPGLGIRSLGDLERAVRRGQSSAGRDGTMLHSICGGTAYIVYNPLSRTLITIRHGEAGRG